MSSVARLPVYKYKCVLSLSNLINQGQLDDNMLRSIQESLVSNILRLFDVDIDPDMLEILNQLYSEKWVSRIDENFYAYNILQKPRLRRTSRASGKVTKKCICL